MCIRDRPTLDGLKVDPCIPHTLGGFTVTRRYRGATYHIAVDNTAACLLYTSPSSSAASYRVGSTPMMAAISMMVAIAILPVIIVYLLLSKFIVRGVASVSYTHLVPNL